jgi:hypothetical protein
MGDGPGESDEPTLIRIKAPTLVERCREHTGAASPRVWTNRQLELRPLTPSGFDPECGCAVGQKTRKHTAQESNITHV